VILSPQEKGAAENASLLCLVANAATAETCAVLSRAVRGKEREVGP